MVRIIVLLWCVVVAACGAQPGQVPSHQAPSPGGTSMSELTFLTRDGCVNTVTMRANLDEALRALGLPSDYQVINLETLAATDARGGYPTPTVLYANKDIFGMSEPSVPYPPPT